jgi:hypothetical protein
VLRYSIVFLFALTLLTQVADVAIAATKLLEFDAAIAGAGVTPPAFDENWAKSGIEMVNTGEFLLQDNTANAEGEYGEYYSPFLEEGTFKRGGAPYGIEFKVRPRTDVPFIGHYWPELYLTWSDDVNNYNVTVDLYQDANTSGLGSIVYGRNSFSPAITDIDWSVPHTIFIGHRGDGETSVFDFYLDGALVSTRIDGSIGRDRTGFELFQDSIGFGDGTTALPSDVAGEWYFVRVWDVNNPAATLPGVVGDYSGNGSVGAEDYTIWRDNLGSSTALPNDPIGGVIGQGQYDQWKAAFGNGAGSSSIGAGAVPEAGTLVLALLSLCGAPLLGLRRR